MKKKKKKGIIKRVHSPMEVILTVRDYLKAMSTLYSTSTKGTCNSCPTNCAICNGIEPNSCKACGKNAFLQTDLSIINSDLTLGECKKCSENCIDCYNEKDDHCKKCKKGFWLQKEDDFNGIPFGKCIKLNLFKQLNSMIINAKAIDDKSGSISSPGVEYKGKKDKIFIRILKNEINDG